jgi:hypothetical protein
MDIQSTSLVPFHARRDPVEQIPRARVRVKLRMKNYLVPSVGLVKQKTADAGGFNEIIVYERDLPLLQADVETEHAMLVQAKANHERNLKAYIRDRSRCTDEQMNAGMDRWNQGMIHAHNTYPGSVEAEFHRITQRGIKPLISLDVIEAGLPPQLTESQTQQATVLNMLAPLLGGGSDVAALKSLVEAQQKQIDALLAKAERPSAKRGD